MGFWITTAPMGTTLDGLSPQLQTRHDDHDTGFDRPEELFSVT
jgi:hypothetical protein